MLFCETRALSAARGRADWLGLGAGATRLGLRGRVWESNQNSTFEVCAHSLSMVGVRGFFVWLSTYRSTLPVQSRLTRQKMLLYANYHALGDSRPSAGLPLDLESGDTDD